MADLANPPLPPADFLFLVESVLMQAQMQLGLLRLDEDSQEGPQPDLAMARHSIDLLGMLHEKTKGNLTGEEQRLLENGLTELRFHFVQIANQLQAKESAAQPSSLLSGAEPAAPSKPNGPMIITPDGGKGSKTE